MGLSGQTKGLDIIRVSRTALQVDFVLCSPELMQFISDFDIVECMPYSEHCPNHVLFE